MIILAQTDSAIIQEQVTQNLYPWTRFWRSIQWDEIVALVITKAIQIVLLSLLFLIFYKIGRVLINRGYNNYGRKNGITEARAKTLERLIDNIFQYSMYFIYIYSVLWVLNVPIGSLLTGAGIAGLAIGLGAQGFINDLITGFSIIVEQQIDVGETVRIPQLNLDGIVVAIGLRTTKLKSVDGALHFIPNRNITTVTNLSREAIRVTIDTRIQLDEGVNAITKVIEEATNALEKEHSGRIQKAPNVFGVVDLGNGNYAIRVVMYAVNGEQFRLNEAFTAGYVQALTEHGFTIPNNPVGVRA